MGQIGSRIFREAKGNHFMAGEQHTGDTDYMDDQ